METEITRVEPLWWTHYADPHLKFTIEFRLGVSHILMQIQADVSACTDSAGSNPLVLGMLYLNPERECQMSSSGARQIEMLLPLTKSALERIEDQRAKANYHNVHLIIRGYLNVLFADTLKSKKKETDQDIVEFVSTNPTPFYALKFEVAKEIAKDHIVENSKPLNEKYDSDYYKNLKQMETQL